jgi:hypothetical protein
MLGFEDNRTFRKKAQPIFQDTSLNSACLQKILKANQLIDITT